MPACPEDVDAHIFVLDIDRGLFDLRQHRDRRRGGMNTPTRLGCRHALDPVNATLVFEAAPSTLAMNLEDNLLIAASSIFAAANQLGLPAVIFGVAAIHAVE